MKCTERRTDHLLQNKMLAWTWAAGSPWNRWVTGRGMANRRLHNEMIYNRGSASKQRHCPVCLPLTRDFVFQLHVGDFAPGRQTHASRPVRGVQLPVGSPGTQTQRLWYGGEGMTAVYRFWCLYGGEEKERQPQRRCVCVSMCYCYDSSNTQTHELNVGWILLYANRTWLRRQTGFSLRPKAKLLHHHPYSLYIWSLVNQSCVSWTSGLCYCLVGVMSTKMQLQRFRLEQQPMKMG